MIIIKCKYSYCKHETNEVTKEDAIKEGNCYYHKDCYKEKILKKEIEEYWNDNMPSASLQILRKVIKQLIHDKKAPADFVLFVMKYIKKNNKPINNPFGLINYCGNKDIRELYKKMIINQKYTKLKSEDNNEIYIEKVNFTYKPSKKKITDII